jgi:hypothetical protein
MGRKPVGYNDMLFFESQDIDSDDTQGGDIDEFIIDVEMEQPNESSKSKYENMLIEEESKWTINAEKVSIAMLKTLQIPEGTLCTECKIENASFLCTSCGYHRKWCTKCCNESHYGFNNHHILRNDLLLGLVEPTITYNPARTMWIDLYTVKTTDQKVNFEEAIAAGYLSRKLIGGNILFSIKLLELYRQLNLKGALNASAFMESIIAIHPQIKFHADLK